MKGIVAIAIVLFSVHAFSEEWKSGKLLHYEQNTFMTYAGQAGYTPGHSVPHTTYQVIIDGGDRTYFAERTLNWRWQKFPVLTENGPIAWRQEKREIVFRDDVGKEFKVTLIKTALKGAASQQQP